MGDFDVLQYCRQLHSLKPPPYECPVADCDQVYSSMTGFQYHLAHIQHESPIPPLNIVAPNKQSIVFPVVSKAKSKKKKERRVSQPGVIEAITPVHLSNTLCEVEVADHKMIQFSADEYLPIISKDDYLKQKKDIKIPFKTAAILSSLSKSKNAVKSLPQATFKEIDSYDILQAPSMPNSYIRFIEKSVEELDTEVEYDFDEQDAAWLQIMNERRESSGLAGVSIESFELLMDRLEKESYFVVQMNKEVASSLAVVDDDAVCSICLVGESQNSNVILFCDMCNLAVHQDCYGVPYIPEGQWFCRRCLHSPSRIVNCVLCPNNCGAFKQTDRELWAHVVCALWIPEVRFANTVFLEPIDSVETIPTDRWKLTCYICKQRGVGACIQCHKTSCYAAFHVTCAQQDGLYMKMETITNDISNIGDAEPGTVLVQKIAFCDAHAPVDYLAENKGRQSPGEKLNNARQVLAKVHSTGPVISIPTIPPERVAEIANLLSVPKKGQFVQRLIAYWTLKRQFRNGVPLIRRLQTIQHSNVSRCREPITSNRHEYELETNKPEQHLIGFDMDDNVLIIIENKKKSVKMELSKETGETMEVEDPSIVNNNHVNKKKLSKSSISSPAPNDVKNDLSNKRHKKYNLRSDELKSLELQVPATLELTTPKINLTTSNKRTRHASDKKTNVDISDDIYKLPFEHGWKRELVYRKSTILNGTNRSGDVYYHSPTNQKLRSLREIQEQLDISADKNLTIESFTFLKQPIGINDRSKEIIRDANSKSSKEESFVGVVVRPKKSETPVHRPPFNYKLSDDKNNKSSSKMKIVLKNGESSSRLRSKKELTTPKIKLTTSNKRTRHASDKKTNVDISDDIYKLPFEHGWKRELVYRKSTILNGTNRSGDVYYHSPTNQKLRSLREIQEQLDISADKNLTIESFTFLKQPIGINDRSKEIIRDANSKSSKEDSFVSVAVRPKKSEIPVQQLPFDYELSDDENNKSSSKMKIVLKNGESSFILRSKEGISESMNTSSSSPEYISENCQALQSSASPTVSSTKLEEIDINNTIIKRRNTEMNGSLNEFVKMQSLNYMVKALGHVFKYLKTHELLSASRVCNTWHLIAMNKYLWKNVSLNNSMVYDWDRFVDSINQQRTDKLDTSGMLIPSKVEDFESFWLRFAYAIKAAQKLKFIELYRCPVLVVEDIIYSLPQIEVLKATSIKNPNLTNQTNNLNDLMYLNLNYLGQMTKLTELRLKGLTGIKLTALPSFENLINLNKFSLTSIKEFPKEIYQSLNTITDNIEFFEIGDCECLTKDFAMSLKRFVNLKTLRLENCCNGWDQSAHDVFTVIRGLEKLNVLELVNIEFSNCVEDELEKCDGIKGLLIIPVYVNGTPINIRDLIDCLKKLSKTLTHLVWGLTHELLRVTDLFITHSQQNPHTNGYNLELSHAKGTTNNIPIHRTRKPRQRPGDESTLEKEKDKSVIIDIYSVPALKELLDTMMPDVKIKVIKVPFSGTGRAYLSEQFNDL